MSAQIHPLNFFASLSPMTEQHKTIRPNTYKARQHWHYYADKGRKLHAQNCIKGAIDAFKECTRLSVMLLHSETTQNNDVSGCELLFIASHNLSACYNRVNKASKAEQVLSGLYSEVVSLCKDEKLPRNIRLDALSILDRCLFSLASQFAFMGRLTQIQPLITRTEQIAGDMIRHLG